MIESAPNVNTPSARYVALERLRSQCRDLMSGVQTLKEKASIYLPRNPSEAKVHVPGVGEIDPWAARVEMSRLRNMFADAVDECAGRVFAKPAEIDEATPEALKAFLDDVDGGGSCLDVFGMAVAARAVAEGNDFVLVDYPEVPPGSNLLKIDEEALKLAPFWRRYSPECVIDWEVGSFGKERRLTRVRLREVVLEAHGPWSKREVRQVRVIYAGDPVVQDTGDASPRWARWEVWRPRKATELQGEWDVYSSGVMRPQVDIPLVDFPTDLLLPFEAVPPYLDLKHLTIAHYRKLSDLDNAQHAVGYPILHWAGGQLAADGSVQGIGPNRFLVSPDPAAHVEFAEPAGTAWASLQAELDRMERQGKELSSEPFEASGSLTATGEAIRAARAHSKLQGWVTAWNDSFSRLLYYTATYLGIVEYGATEGWGGIRLNSKFIPKQQSVDGARLIHDRNLAGKVSDETAFEAIQGADLIPETITYEEELERLAQDGPTGPTDEDRAAEDLTADPVPPSDTTAAAA